MTPRTEAELAGTTAGFVVIGVIVLIWFLVKCFELIVRVLVAHPECKPVWAALAAFLISTAIASLFGGEAPFWNSLSTSSLVVLLMIAKIAEIYYDQLLQNEVSQELVLDQALSRPWWNPRSELAPAA